MGSATPPERKRWGRREGNERRERREGKGKRERREEFEGEENLRERRI